MKKLILAIAVVALIASPAMAVDWNFYGSARVVTWYVSDDYGDTSLLNGDSDDTDFRWGSAGHDNSRFGAKVKAENVSGRVEIQLKASPGGDPGGDITVEDRLIYGEWNFGAGKLLVGKAYTPVSQFISGQAFDEDIGLLSSGAAYGQRIAGLQLSFGGLTVAVLEPNNAAYFVGDDVDTTLPKLEAKYGMSFDMFSFNVMGGYQHYEIDGGGASVWTDDVDIDSYIIGGDAAVNFGPAYLKGAISYGQNVANAAWDITGLYTIGGVAVPKVALDDVYDVDTLQFALVGGFKFTDQVSFEVGFGWREDDFGDVPGADEDDFWQAYGQAVISLAPGVWLIPEIGYQDYSDAPVNISAKGNDQGSRLYAGAKWQIDF